MLAYRQANAEKLRAQDKARREGDPEGFKARRRKEYAANATFHQEKARERYAADPEKFKERERQRRKAKPDIFREIDARKYRKDPISDCIRRGIASSLADNGHSKGGRRFLTFVNWSMQDLRAHLEGLFEAGMSFDNYGTWHIDHVIPKDRVSFEGPEDPRFIQLWALENLAPLWASDNISKNARLDWVLPDHYRNPRLRSMYDQPAAAWAIAA